jgi:hypothetical protein
MIDWRAATALVIAVGIWFTTIVFLGASGFVHKSPELLAAAMIVPLIAIMVVGWFVQSVKSAEQSLPMEALVLVSALRILCGTYFFEAGSGIDADWAVPAGTSGLLLGLTAIPVGLFAVPANEGGRWFALFAWNFLGFVDALVAPLAAIVFGMIDRGSMLSLMQMPMFLLSAFVLPVVLWTHFKISGRLWRGQTS